MQKTVLTVRQLNLYVKSLLDGDIRLNNVAVTGELSNFKNHYSSGHFYFTLKDNDASIRCVMFNGFASRVKFQPYDGLQVVLRGKISLYEKDGQYQFYAEDMLAAGVGDLSLQFEQIKEKLQKEGLFDSESKRKLPEYPQNIAVVTSQTGAAVQDIINILSRRWPISRIVLCPVSVQGELAVKEMIETLDRIYALDSLDVIIIGRGGGSAEDLSAFNSEELARKIYESPIPVISAVGHETDFSISDFVADLRAPTPSAAAELSVPNKEEMLIKIRNYDKILKNSLISKLNYNEARLKACLNSSVFMNPLDAFISRRYYEIDRYTDLLNFQINKILESKINALSKCAAEIDNLSPLKILSRGYLVAKKEGNSVNTVKNLNIDDELSLRFVDGTAKCRITDIGEEKDAW